MRYKTIDARAITFVDTSNPTDIAQGEVRISANARNMFRYHQIAGVASSNGHVYCMQSNVSAVYIASNDRSAQNTSVVVGIAVASLASGNFAWLQVGGQHTSVQTDAGVADKDFLIPGPTDGECDTLASHSSSAATLIFATADAADDANDKVSATIRHIL